MKRANVRENGRVVNSVAHKVNKTVWGKARV